MTQKIIAPLRSLVLDQQSIGFEFDKFTFGQGSTTFNSIFNASPFLNAIGRIEEIKILNLPYCYFVQNSDVPHKPSDLARLADVASKQLTRMPIALWFVKDDSVNFDFATVYDESTGYTQQVRRENNFRNARGMHENVPFAKNEILSALSILHKYESISEQNSEKAEDLAFTSSGVQMSSKHLKDYNKNNRLDRAVLS